MTDGRTNWDDELEAAQLAAEARELASRILDDRPHHYHPTREGRCDICGRAPRSHRATDAAADAADAAERAALRDPKPVRPPKGAALSTIREWDRAYAAWRERNPA